MSTVNCVHLGLFTPKEQCKCDHTKEVDWLIGPTWHVPDLPGALPNVKVGIVLMQPQLFQEEGYTSMLMVISQTLPSTCWPSSSCI